MDDFDLDRNLISGIIRFVKVMILEVLYEGVCYAVGWTVMRIITLGKYPEKDLKSGIVEDQEWDGNDHIASMIGFFLLFSAGIYVYCNVT